MSIDLIAQIVCYCSALSCAGSSLRDGAVFCLKSLGFCWKWSAHVCECALKSHFDPFNSGEWLQEPFLSRDNAKVTARRPCPRVGGYFLNALWAFCPQAKRIFRSLEAEMFTKKEDFQKDPLYWLRVYSNVFWASLVYATLYPKKQNQNSATNIRN